MTRLLLVLLAALVAFPSSASADLAMTYSQSFDAVEASAAQIAAAGNLPNYCHGDKRLQITWTTADMGRTDHGEKVDGNADGWVLPANAAPGVPLAFYSPDRAYVWDPSVCKATIRARLDPVAFCRILWHELLHYVLGPWHTGLLAHDAERPGCMIDEPPRTDLFRALLDEMPASRGPWRVSCTRNSPRMRCKVTSPRARMVRRYLAQVDATGYEILTSQGLSPR